MPLSLSLSFFVFYLHVSGSSSLMALRCNESNLLFDSQTILPAITLIHSGQWILMTMKPVSCEDIFSTSCVSVAGMVLLFHSPPKGEQHLCPFVVASWVNYVVFMQGNCFTVECTEQCSSLTLFSSWKHFEVTGLCSPLSALTFLYEPHNNAEAITPWVNCFEKLDCFAK